MASLAAFAQRYVGVVPALHHQLICAGVDDLLADRADVLVCMSPPASAKSTYISVAAPAYIISRDPTARIISVSRAAELAAEFGGRVKNIVESEDLQRASPVRIAADTRAKDNWKTSVGGGYFAVGASGGVLGKRADWVIADDIHSSFEDAQSTTQLEKIHSWFESDLLSRLTPTGKLIVIGQRLNANDIIGYTLRRAADNPRIRLKLLKFTAECADPTDDPLGRQLHDRMWPEFYTEDYLHDKKRDPFIWKTLWMQEPPSEEGSWVSTEEIRFRPSPVITPEMPLYGATDLALSVNSGDYTVHALIAINSDDEWDIVHVERARTDSDASAQRIISLTQTYRPREWLIDDDNASKVFVNDVASRARSASVPVPWRPMPMRGQDKETRASALRGQFKRRRVFMPADAPWSHWLVKELLQFPNATGSGVDDGVDTLGLFGRRLMSLARATQSAVQLPRRPTTSEMTLDVLWDTIPKKTARF